MRVLSGIQPSGNIHLGNYFGAIRQHIGAQGSAAAEAARAQVVPLVCARLADELELLPETGGKRLLRRMLGLAAGRGPGAEAGAQEPAAGREEGPERKEVLELVRQAEAGERDPFETLRQVLVRLAGSGRPEDRAFAAAASRELGRFDVEEVERYYFIANYHALTSTRDPATLRRQTLDVALDYLSLGLDPARSCIYRQSDVPQVTELTWLLTTVTPMGLLERCHAYKDKVSKGLPAQHGLFAYPVLMAADILIVDADVVPVGQDQKQHIEVARDIASAYNGAFGRVFVLPEPYIVPDVAVVPGTDGQKMSKSYGNGIDVFASGKELKRQVMSIVTDSTPLEAPKDPEKDNVLALLRLFAGAEEIADWERRYRAGGTGYGHAKLRLIELIDAAFGGARERRAELAARPQQVEDVLQDGARRARAVAERTLRRAREACGIG